MDKETNKQDSSRSALELIQNKNRTEKDTKSLNLNYPIEADFPQSNNLDLQKIDTNKKKNYNRVNHISQIENYTNFVDNSHPPSIILPNTINQNQININKSYDNLENKDLKKLSNAISNDLIEDKNNTTNKKGNINGVLEKKDVENRKKKIYKEKNTKIQIFFNIFHVFLLIQTFVCFELNFSSIKGINLSEMSYFSEIIINWFSSPILNLSLKCDQKENYTNFISDYWQGTSAGCKCGENLSRGACLRRTRLKFMCDNVLAIESMPYNLWKNTQICAERMPGGYFDMEIRMNSGDCPKNLRNCGIIDSQNNYLCFDKNKSCPFNKFSRNIKSRNPSDIIFYFSNSNLIFGRDNKNDKILFFMKVGFAQPCTNPYFQNLNFPLYLLNYYHNKQICFPFANGSVKNAVSYDNEYKLIDNYYGEKLYRENGFEEKLLKLPQYEKSEYQRDIFLYGKNYFGLKINCFNKIKSQNSNNQLMLDLNKFISIKDFTDVLIIGISFEVFFLVIIAIILIIFNRKIYRLGRVNKSDMSCYICFFIFSIIILFIYLSIAISTILKMTVADNIRYIFSSNECVYDFTINLFENLISEIDSSRNTFVTLAILLSFKILIWTCFILYSYISLNKIDFYKI